MGLVRTVRACLEARIGEQVDLHSPVVDWMVRHSGVFITRYRKRLSGKSSFRLIYGRDSILPVVKFGETVMFKPLDVSAGSRPGKFEDQWDLGVWLGSCIRIGENIVCTKDGTFRVGAIRRRPADQRWSKDLVFDIVGTPAEPVPGRGRWLPAFVPVTRPRVREPEHNPDQVPEVVARDFKIVKGDVRKHGPTPGCCGCRVVIEGAGAKGHHSKECRERTRNLIAQTDEGVRRLEETEARLTRAVMQEPERLQPGNGAGQGDAAARPRPAEAQPEPVEEIPPEPTAADREEWVREHDRLMGGRDATVPMGRDPVVRNR